MPCQARQKAYQCGISSAKGRQGRATSFRPHYTPNYTTGETMRTNTSGALHKFLIDEARKDGWQSGNWRAAFFDWLRIPPWEGASDPFLVAYVQSFPLLPDLWRIRIEGEAKGWEYTALVVEFLEVEVTSPVTPKKCKAYQDLYWAFDDTASFDLRVFRKDRWGYILPLVTGATMTDLTIRGHRFPNECP